MNMRFTVEKFRYDARLIRDGERGVSVSTDCLYPSMSSVVAWVEGGQDYFVIHDAGGAIAEASGSGARFERPERVIRPVAKRFGLDVSSKGAITSGGVSASDVGALILIVANASRDAALELLSKYRPSVARNAKEIVREILHRRFSEPRIHTQVEIAGASKNHKFDYAIDLENGRRLLLDIVFPDASSVNSAVVASFDIAKRTNNENLIQRIIYDDNEVWNPQDLALLGAVGKPVQLSRLPETIERLVA